MAGIIEIIASGAWLALAIAAAHRLPVADVAPLEWARKKYPTDTIWKVLIRWEWLCGVCVPYMTDGKIRCERVELLETVSREEER